LGVKFIGLMFLILCCGAVRAQQESNLDVQRDVQRSLADVKAAIDTFCNEAKTNQHIGIFVDPDHYVSASGYRVRLIDCTFDRTGPLQGDVIATSLASTKTRLQLRVKNKGFDGNEAGRLKAKIAKYLEEIEDVLNRKSASPAP